MRRWTTEPAVYHEITQLNDNYHFRDIKGTTVHDEIDSEQCQGPLYHESACLACRDIEAYTVAFKRHWQNLTLGLVDVPVECVVKGIKDSRPLQHHEKKTQTSPNEMIQSHSVYWPDFSCEPGYRDILRSRAVSNLTTIKEEIEEDSEDDIVEDRDETLEELCSFKDYLKGMRDEEQRKVKNLKTRLEDISNNKVSFDVPSTLRLAAEGSLNELMTGGFRMKPNLVPKEHRVLLKHIISQVKAISSGAKSNRVKMAVVKISQGLSETLKLMTFRQIIEDEIKTHKVAKPRKLLRAPKNDQNNGKAMVELNPASQEVEEGNGIKKATAGPISAKGSNMTSTEGKEDLIETRAPHMEVRTGRMIDQRASSPKAAKARGKVHEMIKFWESVNTQDDNRTRDRNWQMRLDFTQAGRPPPPQTDTETPTPRDTGQQTHRQIYNTQTNVLTNVLTRPPEKGKENELANWRNGDRQKHELKYEYNNDNFRDIKDTMTHNNGDSASHRDPGPYRLTFQVPDLLESDDEDVSIWAPGQLGTGPLRTIYQVPDLLESDDDGSNSLGPRHDASAPAHVSMWAPGQVGTEHFRTIYQVPDLIESDSDRSINYGPLNEAMSSQLSLLRGHSQADSSAEYLAAVAEQYEAVEAGLDLRRDIRLTYSENRCSTPTRENICDTEDMDYWNAHGYNEASNIGGPVDTSSDFPPQSPYTSSNITTSLFDPHAYMSEPEEIDEWAPRDDPDSDKSNSGTRAWAYVDLASRACQLPEYRPWNHDDIQLHEDADTRIWDPESDHEHGADNPWYLEKDLWGDRGISVFDDTVSLGDEGEGGNDSGCLV